MMMATSQPQHKKCAYKSTVASQCRASLIASPMDTGHANKPTHTPQTFPLQNPTQNQKRSQTAPAIASPLAMSRQAWESLDSISVQDEFQTPVQAVPHFLVEPVKQALKLALRGIVEPNPAAAITSGTIPGSYSCSSPACCSAVRPKLGQ